MYFGFGSTPVAAPADTIAVISAGVRAVGARALICMGSNGFDDIPNAENVKVVREVSHAAVFPACCAVVHHGGAGTTAAGLRAGIPTLILWNGLDQPMWAAAVEHLEVGFGRRFSESTVDSLTADLHRILAPHYAARARAVATQTTTPAESLSSAADLLEDSRPSRASAADRLSARSAALAPAAPAGCQWRRSSEPGCESATASSSS